MVDEELFSKCLINLKFVITLVLDGIFFPESPAKALASGHFKKCPLLFGSNTNEGHYFIIYYLTEIFKRQVSE